MKPSNEDYREGRRAGFLAAANSLDVLIMQCEDYATSSPRHLAPAFDALALAYTNAQLHIRDVAEGRTPERTQIDDPHIDPIE